MIRAGLGSLNKVMRSKLNSAMSVPVWARMGVLTSAHHQGRWDPPVILQYLELCLWSLDCSTTCHNVAPSLSMETEMKPVSTRWLVRNVHRQSVVYRMQIVAFYLRRHSSTSPNECLSFCVFPGVACSCLKFHCPWAYMKLHWLAKDLHEVPWASERLTCSSMSFQKGYMQFHSVHELNSVTSCLSSSQEHRSAYLFLQRQCFCNAACPLNIISRLVSHSVIVTYHVVSQSEADDGLTNERAMSYGGSVVS